MAKVRVYELAKELGLESKQVLSTLNEMGEFVRSASSTIEAPVVRRPRDRIDSDGGAPAKKKAPAKKAPAKAAAAAAKAPAKKAATKKAEPVVEVAPEPAPVCKPCQGRHHKKCRGTDEAPCGCTSKTHA